MRPRHPRPSFSGYISLETKYSLEVVWDALSVLQERGLVRSFTEEEKKSEGLRTDYDLYVLTELGYKSSSKV